MVGGERSPLVGGERCPLVGGESEAGRPPPFRMTVEEVGEQPGALVDRLRQVAHVLAST